VLVDGSPGVWMRRKASEAAVILSDEAAARRRRVRELTGELCLIDVIAGLRAPGGGVAAPGRDFQRRAA
jgi:hypothetical protein